MTGPAALEALGRDRLRQADDRGQRLVVDLARPRPRGARPRGSPPSTQQTAWPTNITSSGKSGSSCLTPASLTPGTSAAVSTRTTPGTASAPRRRRGRVTRAWACGEQHRVGVQDVAGAVHEVVGVERVPGDVQGGALVGQGGADDRVVGASERWLMPPPSHVRPTGRAARCRASPSGRPRWRAGRRSACPRRASTSAAASTVSLRPRPALEGGLGGRAPGSAWRRRRRARSGPARRCRRRRRGRTRPRRWRCRRTGRLAILWNAVERRRAAAARGPPGPARPGRSTVSR